jgi:hypothetical protein
MQPVLTTNLTAAAIDAAQRQREDLWIAKEIHRNFFHFKNFIETLYDQYEDSTA